MADRQKLIELVRDFERYDHRMMNRVDADEIADHLIANGVKIPVLCKNCKNFGRNSENETFCRCRNGLDDPKEDDFCSYGERRTE